MNAPTRLPIPTTRVLKPVIEWPLQTKNVPQKTIVIPIRKPDIIPSVLFLACVLIASFSICIRCSNCVSAIRIIRSAALGTASL